MKTNNPITKSLMAALLAALVLTGGCKNFMSNSEDFKKNIQGQVTVANATQIPVRIIADSKLGSTSPAGQVTEKVGVSFSLLMTTSSDYGFIRWAAYSTTNLKTELGTEVVTFADKTALETTATIHVARSDIQIQPVCEKRPKISTTAPTLGDKGVYLNVPLKIYFSKKMNPSSFIYDDGTKRSSAGLFKNVTINGVSGADASAPMEKFFKDPVLDAETGTILTFSPVSGSPVTPYTSITVEVSQDVVDTSGLTMPDTYTFTYKYGSGNDTNPPTVVKLDVGASAGIGYAGTLSTDHRSNSLSSWIMVTATDLIKWGVGTTTTGSGLNHINIVESRIKDANGSNATDTATSSAPIGSDSDNSEYPFAYTMQIAKDGLIQIDATATDETGNTSPTAVSYQFVRDMTPPPLDAGKVAIVSTGVNGFYNAATHTLEFTANPVDAGSSPYRSADANNQTRFQVVDGSNVSVWSDWGTPAEWLAKSKTLVIPTTFADGTVTVNYQFKDDLGNLSTIGLKDVVTKDTNPPTGTVSVIGTKEGGSVVTIGGKPFVNSRNLKVQVTTSDGANGSLTEYFKITDTTAAPSAIDISGTDTTTIDNVTLDAGSLTVYAWFKDHAENSNATPAASAKVYYDQTPPTISKFWVSKASVAETAAEQYTATNTLYFGFIAKDAPAGIAKFQYADSYGSSQEFSIPAPLSWTGSQGTGNYIVSDVSRSEKYLGVDGQILVTGKLTIPATLGEDTIKLYLTDMVGNKTDDTTLNRTANTVLFDNKAPNVTLSLNGAPTVLDTFASPYYLNSTGTALYTKSTALTANITVQDSPSGSEAVSGASIYDLAGGIVTAITGKSLTGAAAKDSALKSASESITLSGTDGAKTVTVKGYDFVGNVATASKSVTLDTTAPTFLMGVRDTGGTSNLFYKDYGSSTQILGTGTTTYKAKSSFDLFVSAVDGGSGVKNASYDWSLYKAPIAGGAGAEVGTGTIDLSSGSGQTAISGISGSGKYWVSLKVKDNVENESGENYIGYMYDNTPPAISTVEACSYVAGSPASAAALLYKGGCFWINGNSFALRAKGTDRPVGDPYGSGIKSISVNVITGVANTVWTARTYTSGTQVKETGGSIDVVYEPGNSTDWFYLENYDGNTNPQWGGISTVDGFKYYFTFDDVMGNTGTYMSGSTPLVIRYDNAAPIDYTTSYWTGANGYQGLSRGYASSRWYSRTTGDGTIYLKKAALDLGSNAGIASGVKAWALVSSADNVTWTAPTLTGLPYYVGDADYSTKWTAYAAAQGLSGWQRANENTTFGFTDTSVCQSTAVLPEGSPRYLRFYMLDMLNNVSYNNTSFGTETYQIDNTKPVVSSAMVTGTRTDATTSTVATNSLNATVSIVVKDTGSGIGKIEFTGDFTPTSVTTVSGYACSVSGKTITFAPGTSGGSNPGGASAVTLTVGGQLSAGEGAKTVSVIATDTVGNACDSYAASSIIYDTTKPSSTITMNGGTKQLLAGGYGHVELGITESAAASGVRKIVISGGAFDATASLSAVKLYQGGSSTPTGNSGGTQIDAGDYAISKDSSSFTITFNESKVEYTGTLCICNIPLLGTLNGTASDNITAQLVDNAMNESVILDYNALRRDPNPPTLTTVSVVSSDLTSSSTWSKSATVKVTLTYTEMESGLKKITFTGDGTTTVDASGATITSPAGLTVTPGASSLTINSGYPTGTGATVTISGIVLNEAVQGTKDFHVTLQDSAGNDSSAVAGTIKLDTIKPASIAASHTVGTNEYKSGTNYFTKSDASISFNLSASDDGGVYQYCRGTTNVFGSASPLTPGAVTDSITPTTDSTTYYYWAVDQAGNHSLSSYSVTVMQDNVYPVNTVLGAGLSTAPVDLYAPSTINYVSGATVSFTPSDGAGSGIKGYVVNTTTADITELSTGYTANAGTAVSAYDFSGLVASAASNVYVHFLDNVGNQSYIQVGSNQWRKDSDPPLNTVSLTVNRVGTYNSVPLGYVKSATLSFTPSDAVSGMKEYGFSTSSSVAPTVWTGCTDALVDPSGDFSTLVEGSSGTVFIWFKDNVNHTSSKQITSGTIMTWRKDVTSPDTAISLDTSVSTGFVTDGTNNYVTAGKVKFTPADLGGSGMSGYKLTTDTADVSSGWTANTGVQTTADFTSLIGSGATNVYLHLIDNVGNQTYVQVGSKPWWQDKDAPTLDAPTFATAGANEYDSGLTRYTQNSSVTMNLKAADTVITAGGASSGVEGLYYKSSIDGGTTWSGYTALTLDSGDIESGCTVSLPATTTSTQFKFYAKDVCGQYSSAGSAFTVLKDLTLPSLPTATPTTTGWVLNSGTYYAANATATNDVALSGSTDTGGSGVDCYGWSDNAGTDKNWLAHGTTSYTITPAATAKTYTFYAKDYVGNVSAVAATSCTVKIDNSVPNMSVTDPTDAIPIDNPSTDHWVTSGSSLAFTLSGSDPESGFDHYMYTIGADATPVVTGISGTTATISSLPATFTEYKFYTVDKLGNQSAPVSRWLAKDTTAPSVPDADSAGGPVVTSSGSYVASETSDVVYVHDGTVTFTPADSGTTNSGTWFIDSTATYSTATSFTTSGYSAASTKGTWNAGTEISGVTLPVTVTSAKFYIHIMDNVGNIGVRQIYTGAGDTSDSWILDTTAPSASAVTASGTTAGYYYKATGAAAATLYYRTAADCSALGTLSGATDTGGSGGVQYSLDDVAYSASISPTSVAYASSSYWIKDAVGNKTEVTITGVNDTAYPVITFLSSNSSSVSLSVTDSGTTDSGVATCEYVSGAGYYSASKIAGLNSLSNGASETTDLKVTDNVGRWATYTVTRTRNTSYSGSVSSATDSGSIRGFVPPVIGTIASQYVYQSDSDLSSNVYTKSGKGGVVWNQSVIEKTAAAQAAARTEASTGAESSAVSMNSVEGKASVSTQLSFSNLSTRHAQALALARARFVPAQNTDAARNGADKIISPETANNVKQDDSGRLNGVGYNQELVRIARSAMTPLAEQYLARHGVSFDGLRLSAEGQTAGAQTADLQSESAQSGLTSGPGIGMLIPPKDFRAFRREPGFDPVG